MAMDPTSNRETATPESGAFPVQTRPTFRLATFQALRHRHYRLFFYGQLVSLIGTWMQNTALTWLAFELEHKNRWPDWVSAALLVPTCLLGPWSGALADRFPRR